LTFSNTDDAEPVVVEQCELHRICPSLFSGEHRAATSPSSVTRTQLGGGKTG
jgi:hypothetical protein